MNTLYSFLVKAAVVLTLTIPAWPVEGQVLNAPSRLSSAREPGVYEQLLIKNRGRYLGGQVSPSGELYLYLDESQFQAAQRSGDDGYLSPTVPDTAGIRGVAVAVVSRVPQTLRVDRRAGDELEIGVIRLPEEHGAGRPIAINSVIDMAPLWIHGSGGRRSDQGDSFLGGGGRARR